MALMGEFKIFCVVEVIVHQKIKLLYINFKLACNVSTVPVHTVTYIFSLRALSQRNLYDGEGVFFERQKGVTLDPPLQKREPDP